MDAHTLWIDAERGSLFANGTHLPSPAGGVGGMFALDIGTSPTEQVRPVRGRRVLHPRFVLARFPGSDLILASDIEGGLFVLGYTGS